MMVQEAKTEKHKIYFIHMMFLLFFIDIANIISGLRSDEHLIKVAKLWRFQEMIQKHSQLCKTSLNVPSFCPAFVCLFLDLFVF